MGKVVVIFIAIVASMSLLSRTETAAPLPFAAGLYDVSLDFGEPLQATVRATLSVTDGQLFTWSSDIKHLRAFSNEGKEIQVVLVAPNHWRFLTLTSQTVQITYDVDLSFTKPVAERSQGGQPYGDAFYVINQTLFVLSDALGERTVHFEVPASFTIATPLKQIAPSTYAAAGNRELASNATVFEWFPRVPTVLSCRSSTIAAPSRCAASNRSRSTVASAAHGTHAAQGATGPSWPPLLF
jgi:Peptidase M61 N-terminal domain